MSGDRGCGTGAPSKMAERRSSAQDTGQTGQASTNKGKTRTGTRKHDTSAVTQAGEVHACTVPVQVQHPRSWPLLSTLRRGWLNPLCEARIFSARVLSISCPDMSSAVATAYACLAPGCACLPVLFLKIRQFRGHVRSTLAWPCAARTKAHASKASCASPFQAAASEPLRCLGGRLLALFTITLQMCTRV
eukprot:CAMPEP_0179449288 /NCGR_PEP_ID=MMETSP0799-20121207/33276_1 /TAXON_ID=46947 /ORGANISM="Geminigera cryophila, Strain CCMP2564" /LENGTH=189 /DNA_ID=CAMNT_0021242265 /DNA_START=52 /DNA_END=619 /DNA_ORIENTATION=-